MPCVGSDCGRVAAPWGTMRPSYRQGARLVQHRNRASARMSLVVSVLAAGLLVIALGLTGCSNGGGKGTITSKDSTSGTGSGTAGGTATIEGQVGKPLAVGGVKIAVTGLSAVAKPLLPRQVADPETIPVPLGTGGVFYQAWVRVQNGGKTVTRVDPRDFSLTYGGKSYFPDLARSGPPATSLIPTSSLELILIFQVPAGAKPDLLYRPPWYGGKIVIKGQKKPAGVALAPSPRLGA